MDEIEARVTALEGQTQTRLGALEDQVKAVRDDAAARVPGRGADRDVAEFAQVESQGAEMRAGFARLDSRFDNLGVEMRARFAEQEARFDGKLHARFAEQEAWLASALDMKLAEQEGRLDGKFAELAAGQDAITGSLTRPGH
jgi:hypothetical protein